jgi:hypothetical protein
MYKKIALAAATLTLLASPLFVSAQTTDNSSLIAAIRVLIQQLETEITQILGAQSMVGTQEPITASASNPQTAASGMTTDVALVCNASTGLKRGDTDATTNGQVSRLQAMLGISPTTGYYGAQTAIGYNNICIGGNSQPKSVSGMSEYVGADFSFWYPSTWTVQQITKAGGGVMNSLSLYGPTGNDVMDIDELTPLNGALGNVIDANDTESYYFDSNTGVWTYSRTSFGKTTTSPAPIPLTTIGGLHVFTFEDLTHDDIIPLSATKFVTVSDTSDTHDVRPLARTVVATNPNVATPIPTAQQTAVIQAEASAYGVSVSSASNISSTSGFSVSPTSGVAPLQVRFTMQGNALAFTAMDFGNGDKFIQGNGSNVGNISCDAAGTDTVCSGSETYNALGTYTVTLYGASGAVLDTATITVTQ